MQPTCLQSEERGDRRDGPSLGGRPHAGAQLREPVKSFFFFSFLFFSFLFLLKLV